MFFFSPDIDECSEQPNDVCRNGVCKNTYGSFSCDCALGYILDDTKKNCRGDKKIERNVVLPPPTNLKQWLLAGCKIFMYLVLSGILHRLIFFPLLVSVRHRRMSRSARLLSRWFLCEHYRWIKMWMYQWLHNTPSRRQVCGWVRQSELCSTEYVIIQTFFVPVFSQPPFRQEARI